MSFAVVATLVLLLGGSKTQGSNHAAQGDRKQPPDITPLADKKEIVGEWKRVEQPRAVKGGSWRIFSANGEFRVKYGDVALSGTYRFVDATTLETSEVWKGKVKKVYRWKVGRVDGKLVLIHLEYGWVEKYVSVPAGSLRPQIPPEAGVWKVRRPLICGSIPTQHPTTAV